MGQAAEKEPERGRRAQRNTEAPKARAVPRSTDGTRRQVQGTQAQPARGPRVAAKQRNRRHAAPQGLAVGGTCIQGSRRATCNRQPWAPPLLHAAPRRAAFLSSPASTQGRQGTVRGVHRCAVLCCHECGRLPCCCFASRQGHLEGPTNPGLGSSCSRGQTAGCKWA